MTIDEDLLAQVDTLVEELGTNRSAFMRDALESALKQRQITMLEQHRAGKVNIGPLLSSLFTTLSPENPGHRSVPLLCFRHRHHIRNVKNGKIGKNGFIMATKSLAKSKSVGDMMNPEQRCGAAF